MFSDVEEVKEAIKNNRFEIVLKNVQIHTENEEDLKDQAAVFEKIPQLNFLSLQSCSLTQISDKLGKCSNLTKLVLQQNQLTAIPDMFAGLKKLKFVDFSNNSLESLPQSISGLESLESLILANNRISENGIPDLSKLVQLHIFDCSHNSLSDFPASLTNSSLSGHLHTIDLSHNEILEIPTNIENLKLLKDFKINNNSLTDVPRTLSTLSKLKFLNMSENKFSDTRFRKLCNDSRAKVAAVLTYVAKNGRVGEKKKKRVESEKTDEIEVDGMEGQEENNGDKITVATGIENLTIRRHPTASHIRPYLACCVFKNVDLNGDAFRKFITLQTKLHSSPLCDNRALAAIGTHRLDSFEMPLTYMALPKSELHIRALNKKTSVCATELLDNLLRDAELARKRSKRSTIDPLHKYLHIVRDEPIMACFVDSQQMVISLPPITQSDITKLTIETTNIWVEVTSKVSLEACKAVLNELVMSSRQIFPNLALEQVRVIENDNIVSIFPDKHDLDQLKVEKVSA